MNEVPRVHDTTALDRFDVSPTTLPAPADARRGLDEMTDLLAATR